MATKIIHTSYIQVLGRIWMPSVKATYTYMLSNYDLNNISPLTREEIELWLTKNAGDFQEIIDFCADIYDPATKQDIVFEWSDPESELEYNDITYPSDDF